MPQSSWQRWMGAAGSPWVHSHPWQADTPTPRPILQFLCCCRQADQSVQLWAQLLAWGAGGWCVSPGLVPVA